MNFSQWIEGAEKSLLNQLKQIYMTPDEIWGDNNLYDISFKNDSKSMSFIYINNHFYKQHAEATHNDIIAKFFNEIKNDCAQLGVQTNGIPETRNMLQDDNIAILGRTCTASTETESAQIVTVWNTDSKKVVDCLNYMLNNNLITKDSIYSYHEKSETVAKFLNLPTFAPQDRNALALHLLPAGEKNKMLKAMGARSPDRPKGLIPGQKLWALNSEGLNEF